MLLAAIATLVGAGVQSATGFGFALLAGALILLAGALAARRRPTPGGSVGRPATIVVGVAAGTLTTTTTVNGPPIVLWLQRRGASAGQARDSLAAAFAVLNLLGAAAVTVAPGGVGGPGARPLTVLWLLPALLAGQLIGRRIFDRLDPARFRALALGLVLAAGVASIVAGVAAAG